MKTKYIEASITDAAARYVREMAGDRTVVLGPLAWQPSDGMAAKIWYFLVVTSDRRHAAVIDQITVQRDTDRDEFRMALLTAKPALVVHDTDDELNMARLCEKLWPGERISRIRSEIEAERAA